MTWRKNCCVPWWAYAPAFERRGGRHITVVVSLHDAAYFSVSSIAGPDAAHVATVRYSAFHSAEQPADRRRWNKLWPAFQYAVAAAMGFRFHLSRLNPHWFR